MFKDFTALDFETSHYEADSACSIGLVKVRDGQIVQSSAHLIKPPRRMFMFTHVHGIHPRDVEKAPTFGELWPSIAHYFKDSPLLAAHNAGFDRRVLMACCSRYGIEPPLQPFECSMELARSVWNLRPTKLSDVARFLGISLNHHEALSDALACAKTLLAVRAGYLGEPTQISQNSPPAPLS